MMDRIDEVLATTARQWNLSAPQWALIFGSRVWHWRRF